MRIASLVLSVALMTSQARAELMITGIGANPCTFLNANTRSGDGWATNAFTLGAMAWMQGFMSGANVMIREAQKKIYDLDTISRDQQWAYVMEFCRRNPDRNISRAVEDLMLRRLRIMPAAIPLKGH